MPHDATAPRAGETAATPDIPYYLPTGSERALFETAHRNRLPLLLKGPTGCGKTRFVAHMAAAWACPCTPFRATTT